MICTLLNIRLLYWVTKMQRLVMTQFERTYVDTRGSGLHCLWRLWGCSLPAFRGFWWLGVFLACGNIVLLSDMMSQPFSISARLSLSEEDALIGYRGQLPKHHLDPESSHICKDRVQNEVPSWTWCHIVKREEDFGWALLTVSQNYTVSIFLFETESRVSCPRDNIQIECVARDDFELRLLLSAPPHPVYVILEVEFSALCIQTSTVILWIKPQVIPTLLTVSHKNK